MIEPISTTNSFFFNGIRNYEKYFLQALKLRRLIYEDYIQVWKQGVDFLLTPVTLTDAPLFSEFKLLDSRTQSAQQVQHITINNPNTIVLDKFSLIKKMYISTFTFYEEPYSLILFTQNVS